MVLLAVRSAWPSRKFAKGSLPLLALEKLKLAAPPSPFSVFCIHIEVKPTRIV